MKTSKQLTDRLRLMGCKVKFKPYYDTKSESVLLEVRHPAEVVDGCLVGSEIDIYNQSTFRIWTPQNKKAKAYASRYNLHMRNLDGECELFVPAHLADGILPKFGAKVKRVFSEKAKAHLKAIGFKKHTLE